ncbi:hypothetical protein JW905_17365 [bacterium]|nr:hypothetical protein [candidate division CSSED10-310 bacterium]
MEIVTYVFCCSEDRPEPEAVVEGSRLQGVCFDIVDSDANEDGCWSQLMLKETESGRQIAVDCLAGEGSCVDAFSQEMESCGAMLDGLPESAGSRLVRDHLSATRFLVRTRFEIEDPNDELFDFNSAILIYIHDNHDGMIFARDEGFYDDQDELIVSVAG